MREIHEVKEIHAKKPRAKYYRDMRAKLIFNPSAGAARGSLIGILDVIHEMQAWKLVPEAFLVEAGGDLPGAVGDALAQGIRMFLSKLDLVDYMLHGVGTGNVEDPRIRHFHVRRVGIDTQPAMQIMADGIALGEGRVRIEVRRRVLAVMVGKSTPEALPVYGEILEAVTHAGSG